MKVRSLHWLFVIFPLALIGLLLSACGELPANVTPLQSHLQHVERPVDPLFEQYYQQRLGGSEQAGPVISGLSNENGKQCQYTTNGVMCYDPAASGDQQFSYAAVRPTSNVDTPYDRILERMGGRQVFGEPQGQPVITEDGQMEQVYANIVVYSPPDDPNEIHFRPLARVLGMPAGQPGPKIYDRRHNVIFYPVDGELGFHVPVVFDEFIAQHGGVEKSGKPISEPMAIQVKNEPVARQCFENYCLDYYKDTAPGNQVRLAPLGMQYTQNVASAAYVNVPAPVNDTLAMLVSEDKAQVTATDSQTFYLLIYKDHTKEPQAGVTATIDLMLPDGASYTYQTPPTGLNGWTSLTIPPLANLEHGMMVAYKVCLNQPVEPQNCVSDMYLIWNYQ